MGLFGLFDLFDKNSNESSQKAKQQEYERLVSHQSNLFSKKELEDVINTLSTICMIIIHHCSRYY